MSKKIRVFISSKQKEFRVERLEISKLLSSVAIFEPVLAEDWDPARRPIEEVYLDEVVTSPIYIGLFGCIYSEPTEKEYRAARKNSHREILVYFKECASRDAGIEKLYSELNDPSEGHAIKEFADWGDLKPFFLRHVMAAVTRMIELYQQIGDPPVARGSDDVFARRLRMRAQRLGLPGAETAESAKQWASWMTNALDDFRLIARAENGTGVIDGA